MKTEQLSIFVTLCLPCLLMGRPMGTAINGASETRTVEENIPTIQIAANSATHEIESGKRTPSLPSNPENARSKHSDPVPNSLDASKSSPPESKPLITKGPPTEINQDSPVKAESTKAAKPRGSKSKFMNKVNQTTQKLGSIIAKWYDTSDSLVKRLIKFCKGYFRRDKHKKTQSSKKSISKPPSKIEPTSVVQGETKSAQGDTKTHAEGDTKTHAEGDTKTHAEGDTKTHAEGDTKTHAEGDTKTHAEGDTKTL